MILKTYTPEEIKNSKLVVIDAKPQNGPKVTVTPIEVNDCDTSITTFTFKPNAVLERKSIHYTAIGQLIEGQKIVCVEDDVAEILAIYKTKQQKKYQASIDELNERISELDKLYA